jgi:hypothetical protein
VGDNWTPSCVHSRLLVLVFVFHSNRPMLHGPSFRLAQSLENILRYFSLEDIDE